MFSKKNRLTRRECDALFAAKPRTLHTPHLLLRILPAEQFKAAVTVSKKYSRRATDRNRIRRRVFEALRQSDISAQPLWVMVSPKKGTDIVREPLEDLVRELDEAGLKTRG